MDMTAVLSQCEAWGPVDRLALATELVAGCDVSGIDEGDIGRVASGFARLRGATTATEAAYTSRVARLAADGRSAPVEQVLTRHERVSDKTAMQRVAAAETLAAFPALAESVGGGRVGDDHIQALARMVARLDDSDRAAWSDDAERIARTAERTSPEEFARQLARRHRDEQAAAGISRAEQDQLRNRCVTDVNPGSGRFRLELDMDPEWGTRIEHYVQSEMDAMRAQKLLDDLHPTRRDDIGHLRAYAVARLLERGATGTRGPGRTAGQATEIIVLIDEQTLRDGVAHAQTVCEWGNGQPVDIATVRRLACDAGILPVVLNGDGVVLDEGRAKRLATRDQRRALRAMYRTCGADCEVPYDRCEIHHVTPWFPTGETNLDDLVPLCPRHHHLVHDNGWQLHLSPDRTLTITAPDGTLISQQPLRPLRPPGHAA